MSQVLITESHLTNIANAIRAKNGSNATYTPAQMSTAIAAIQTGGGHEVEDSIITRTISGSYTNSRLTTVGYYAFYSCSRLAAVSFPECTTIRSSAFQSCAGLTIASFPECTTIEVNAFAFCSSLSTIYFPKCTAIGSSAFNRCLSLSTVYFPKCTTIWSYTFYNCDHLSTTSFPECTTVGENAFYFNTSLLTVNFPKCTAIRQSAFIYCQNLATTSFPKCTTIGSSAFRNCSKLISAYFLGTSVPTLSASNAFSSTPIAGYTTSTGGVYGSIFVKASLLTAFQSKTNWTYFSSRMVGLTDAEIAALEG